MRSPIIVVYTHESKTIQRQGIYENDCLLSFIQKLRFLFMA